MIDLYNYEIFVDGVTSETSRRNAPYIETITQLAKQGLGVSRLTTASIGLSGEVGEFNDIVKKILFQGKPFNKENREKLESELGDIMWYWAQACMALNLDPHQVIEKNIEKLEHRYPGGKFTTKSSEER